MGYHFDHPALFRLRYAMNTQKPVWEEGLKKVADAADEMVSSDAYDGVSAANIKNYFSEVYPSIIGMMSTALFQLDRAITEYNSAFLQANGGDGTDEAVIDEQELQDFYTRLNSHSANLQLINTSTDSALDKITDIVFIPYAGLEGFESELKRLARKLDELNERVRALDSVSSSDALSSALELLNSVSTFIRAQLKLKRLENYSSQAVLSSPEYKQMAMVYNKAYDNIEANTEKIKAAQETEVAALDAQYEAYLERVEEAKRAKLILSVACVVASVAVSAVTLGAAAPAVMIATGAITGAVSAGIGSIYDQRIGTPGFPGTVSAGRVFGDAFVGGVIGGATSAISVGAGSIGQELTKGVTNGFSKALIQGGVGGAKNVLINVTSGTVNAAYGSLTDGTSFLENLDSNLKGGSGSILTNLGSSFAGGFAGGFVSTGAKNIMGSVLPKSADDSFAGRMGKLGLSGAVSEGSKGISSRFASTLVSGGDLEKSLDKAFDSGSILLDTTTGAASEMVTGYREYKVDEAQRTADESVRAKQPKKSVEERAEEKGILGVKSDKNGCPVFKDGKKVYTAEPVENDKAANKEAYNRLVENGYLDKNNSRYDAKTGEIWAYDDNGDAVQINVSNDSTAQRQENIRVYDERVQNGSINESEYTLDRSTGRVTYHREDGTSTEVNLKSSPVIYTGEDGQPLRTEITPAYTGNKTQDRITDNKNTYDAMVKNGQLDPNTSWCDEKTGIIHMTDSETNTEYQVTVHHNADYNVKSDTLTVELVSDEAHGQLHHSGGRSQVDSAHESSPDLDAHRAEMEQSTAKKSGINAVKSNTKGKTKAAEDRTDSYGIPSRGDWALGAV